MNVSAVAIHEAGHAVVCFVHKLPVTQICVDGWTGPGVDGQISRRGREWWQAMVRVCLAGGAAERIAFGDNIKTGDAADIEEAKRLLSGVYGADVHGDLLLQKMYLQTLGLLTIASHWQAVEVIADALAAKKRLSGEEARALVADQADAMSDDEIREMQRRLDGIRERGERHHLSRRR